MKVTIRGAISQLNEVLSYRYITGICAWADSLPVICKCVPDWIKRNIKMFADDLRYAEELAQ